MTSTQALKNLTFGFEIEGMFAKKLIRNFDRNNRGRFKEDGSVNLRCDEVDDFVDKYDLMADDLQFSYQEFESKIFKDYEEMLKVMNKFTPPNFLYNSSCGLHLHIGNTKLKNHIWQGLFNNWKLITELQNWAKDKLCDCQTRRLANGNSYCRLYPTKKKLINDFNHLEKYNFMAFHPLGTLEFRFFSPCEHKVENVKKLTEKILNYIIETKPIIKKNSKLEIDPRTIALRVNLKDENKKPIIIRTKREFNPPLRINEQ